ncbi:MAG TPA: DUF1538 family protein [Clostridiales bacterium]|nr:DUF1538 family protein [Candidatus Delongbacteria bacterium]HXK49648.1 DUF1538 family protein [Clostridiales bacterium]
MPLRTTLIMAWNYAVLRIGEQIKSLAFIILYLTGFQIIVLGSPPTNSLKIAFGVSLVIFGLAFFLEGIFLGLMPLGEKVGLYLPQRTGIIVIVLFGLFMGLGATFAEPAIASLRFAGSGVVPWSAPLLYRILENEPQMLIVSIGAGVGVAVACGMIRFYYGISIKPFIFTIIPVLLAATVYCSLDKNLVKILGLAWDSGAVTTGAVTVPLVLALGIGVSKAMGKSEGASGGFGVVMLASAFPVLGVLILGIVLNSTTPYPVTETEFFSAAHREKALSLAGTEEALLRLAYTRGTNKGRESYFGDENEYRRSLLTLSEPQQKEKLIGSMTLNEWLINKASPVERDIAPADYIRNGRSGKSGLSGMKNIFKSESKIAFFAVLPLTLLLLIVLLLFLRVRPKYFDEVVLGIIFALIGMTLLTSGIRTGLAPLGDEVGRSLPRVFKSIAREEGRVLIEPFDEKQVITVFSIDGDQDRFFYLKDGRGNPVHVPFIEANYDKEKGRYEHIVKKPPLFGPELTLLGIALVLLFAFGLGYGSTLAEPSLTALGSTVEELTVGAVRKKGVIQSVSVGVGAGLVVGVIWLMYDLPTLWMILPPYLLVLALTYWSDEDFSGIAWDCGGVTTGSVTVPLVLAMGLSIGGELHIADGFGILAMASVYPIITVLLYGLSVKSHQRRSIMKISGEV